MPKFADVVGFSTGNDVETSPGVWVEEIIEILHYGDLVRTNRRLQGNEKINNDVSVSSNSISVVADPYSKNHFFNIRYVRWAGQVWDVDDVDATNPPRLILRLGGVYNGATA